MLVFNKVVFEFTTRQRPNVYETGYSDMRFRTMSYKNSVSGMAVCGIACSKEHVML